MRTNPDGEIAPINGPQSNLFIIASQKVKAISAGYAPICNFCGNVCDNNQWFNKKTNMRLESGSIHDVLKKVTSCYILCKGCFDLGNFPKVLSSNDFEKSTIQSMLMTPEFEQYLE